MPLTPDMRRRIDQIRGYLYGGGFPDPLSNAEQLAFLFFFLLVEGIDADNGAQAEEQGEPYRSLFAGEWELRNPLNAPAPGVAAIPAERFRWSVWARGMSGEPLVRFVRDEVFPFFSQLAQSLGASFMAGARLAIDEPTVLTQVVELVDGLGLGATDADTKGDLFEHVLRQVKQAGELGQFRTPRHIIRAVVRLVDPKAGETVYDPAAGTAGFLVAAYDHIRLANSSPAGTEEVEVDGKTLRRGAGDRLNARQWRRLRTGTFFGNDVDPKMVNLATMNLTLRGLPDVRILRRNVLTTVMDRAKKAERGLPLEGFDVVLANPPFSGRVDRDRIVDEVRVGSTTATELLFLRYMLDALKPGGRCGVVVPEGVLFGSTGAHKELRRMLMEETAVEAVLSLPGGVFQPYSGVKTSVLVFHKGRRTERVMFLHTEADGYKLDANHDTLIEADDLPGLVSAFAEREACWERWRTRDAKALWGEKWWFAEATALREADNNLSAGRWRPQAREQIRHRDPLVLLDELKAIEAEIAEEVDALMEKLREGAA
ncbi:class I SAM-dependent DNA methyltransferase [Sabulicella glaciei]|uniref:site-specific DNA-methyltransferase (adenine-specific) n=1 Tax=Sabulicella glaciei TaxID=2984948 RepID=A0ABT3P0U3_9PROT|nr:class I SAM-dependent DNA methyltransferase [Roseococcus sp. MDT2-1-1]MCW8088034.1 type I restriction-modification system subunit M [Roseococcus sp. MDT2-1-1]